MPSRWKDKVVVVTGGSSGLGLAIVQAFCEQQATVVSVARNEERQKQSIGELQKSGYSVDFVLADVTDDQSVEQCVAEIVTRYKRIDVWINNVGKSLRVGFEEATVASYQDLMDVNFYTAVRCSLAALPHLESTSGSLVNIGSLASKTGWKFVAPYVTSKHALAGFAHQLRLEGPESVHTMFVCPGPIRRADEQTRYVDAASELGSEVARPGAGAKLSGIQPAIVAQRIVRGCENRTCEIVIPAKSRIAFSILQIWPKLGDWILGKFSSK